jgi:hypothetical protein
MIDLAAANKLMGNLEYLAGPAAENLWHHLITAIRALADDGEDIALPAWTEPRAWAKAYRIYQMLQHRQKTRPPETPDLMMSAFAASWTAYIRNRLEFLQLIRRDDINNTDALFLGLKPGDLDPPTVDNADELARVGIARHPDWRDRAVRTETALGKWESMTAAQKSAIPEVMLARRAAARTKELENRLSILESISNHKELSL